MSPEHAPSRTADTIFLLRGLAALGWTGLIGVTWLQWIVEMARTAEDDPGAGDPDRVLGAAACIATGCSGGIWLLGMLTILLVFAFFRR